MKSHASTIFKIFLLSAVISVAIKYGGPLLPVSASTPVALGAVLLPPLGLAIALGWRARQTP